MFLTDKRIMSVHEYVRLASSYNCYLFNHLVPSKRLTISPNYYILNQLGLLAKSLTGSFNCYIHEPYTLHIHNHLVIAKRLTSSSNCYLFNRLVLCKCSTSLSNCYLLYHLVLAKRLTGSLIAVYITILYYRNV